MSKVTEFYAKALSDEKTKSKLGEILAGKSINEADDSQLEKIGELAKELGFEITIDEAKSFLNNSDGELSDDDLEAVAGGTASSKTGDNPSDPIYPRVHPGCECGIEHPTHPVISIGYENK